MLYNSITNPLSVIFVVYTLYLQVLRVRFKICHTEDREILTLPLTVNNCSGLITPSITYSSGMNPARRRGPKIKLKSLCQDVLKCAAGYTLK